MNRRSARFLLAFLGLVLGIGIAEFVARVYFRGIAGDFVLRTKDLYYFKDAFGVRHHMAGKIGSHRSWDGNGRVEICINQRGFRGPEIALPKPKNLFRILFIGDSVTLSGCTRQEDTFVKAVEHYLPKMDSKKIETVNGGVGDVGLREEIKLLEKSVEIDPDAVVLVWYLNDARPPQGFPDEVVYNHPLISLIHRAEWARKSLLVRLVYEKLRNKLISDGVEGAAGLSERMRWVPVYNEARWKNSVREFLELVEAARYDWGDAWNPESMGWTIDKIITLRMWLERRGIPLIVVATPVNLQVGLSGNESVSRKPQRWLGEALAKEGIPFFDLIDPLRKEPSAPTFFDQCHYTPKGNQLVGRALAEFLREWGKNQSSG